MISRAENKFLRLSPRKTREVIDLIRGEDVSYALGLLPNLNKRPRDYVLKTLRSAIANAKVKGIEPQQLYISRISADEGARWKRYRAAAFGRAAPILKRTVHLKIELDLKHK
ncbi:MAG: 50S ribosomal protein L22 [Candidatus Omnitrophica bacterium CG11_big_fil_rev_8_21_14_0_20_42_13]|uniref:Large ribosomal subunit protein uL22 n=1 Tax=Candidatus Ghiorseimicrobium undicola TaxID=1974746 RepID=A0A2H0LVH9_9BACT|nr:MAG: 50S ribosomal protein L22 [Candidatus Omnitrophica bacterium CG11_big_fil_rev_8_21_14_0_20_42_13]